MSESESAGLLKQGSAKKDIAYGTHKIEKSASAFETVRQLQARMCFSCLQSLFCVRGHADSRCRATLSINSPILVRSHYDRLTLSLIRWTGSLGLSGTDCFVKRCKRAERCGIHHARDGGGYFLRASALVRGTYPRDDARDSAHVSSRRDGGGRERS